MLTNIVTLKSGLEVTQAYWPTRVIRKLRFLFAHGHIYSRLWDIQCHRMVWPWEQSQGSFKVIRNGTIW